MPLTADGPVLPPPRLNVPWRLLQAPRVDRSRDLRSMAGLLVKGHRGLGPAVVPLKAAALQVHPGDGDSRVPVG